MLDPEDVMRQGAHGEGLEDFADGEREKRGGHGLGAFGGETGIALPMLNDKVGGEGEQADDDALVYNINTKPASKDAFF